MKVVMIISFLDVINADYFCKILIATV